MMAGKNFDISKFAATLKPVSESDTMMEIPVDDIRDNPRNFYPRPDTQSLRALADPTRRAILELLRDGRKSAGELADHFAISAAAVSRHLSVLKEADLIRDDRRGKFIFYELNASVLEEILLWLTRLKGDGQHVENP